VVVLFRSSKSANQGRDQCFDGRDRRLRRRSWAIAQWNQCDADREKGEHMSKVKVAAVVALVAGFVLAAAAVASTSRSTISLRGTAVGKVLVAGNGRTLYLFTHDKGKTSTCYGQCAAFWPPLMATRPTVGAGLKASLLGTTKRRNGKLQVTYRGHPLYFFAQDKKAGDIHGQGFVHFGGAWWVVSAAGAAIKTKP
jgi:predicted lipoprotein with Yx(FWY)xxD motif